jgi:hypothetical protein
VTLDGEPIQFEFATPQRVLSCRIETESFGDTQRPGSVWERIGRAIAGGPARTYANFDRGLFRPDAEAPVGACGAFEAFGTAPEASGLRPGDFARLRGTFEGSGSAEMAISGSDHPMLVFVNGELVPGLSGDAATRRSDISAFLQIGGNEVEVVVHLLPRPAGAAGLRPERGLLPDVWLAGADGTAIPVRWELCPGLAGEAAGWDGEAEARRWHFIRFGPWRERGTELAAVRGVGWYRASFALPEAEAWTVPYHLRVELSGAGRLYANGKPLAALRGDGRYVLPLPGFGLRAGEENVVAAALYGLSPQTGLHRLDVGAEEGQMTRRRRLEIRF